MRLKKEDGRSKVKVLSPNKFSNCFWLLQDSPSRISLSLSLSHLPYGKDIRMENWGRKKKESPSTICYKAGQQSTASPESRVFHTMYIGLPTYTHAVCVCVFSISFRLAFFEIIFHGHTP